MSKPRAILIGVAVLALLAAPAFLRFQGSLTFLEWDPPAPGTLLAEATSPDGSLAARVHAASTIGRYVFELRRLGSGEIVASREIKAPVGYHAHRITLEWESTGKRVVAVIDHDFGNNNLRFPLGL